VISSRTNIDADDVEIYYIGW